MTGYEATVPTDEEVKLAIAARDELGAVAGQLDEDSAASVVVPSGVEVPRKAFLVLLDALGELAKGRVLQLVTGDAELSTQQAADLLNVSRPYLIRLLEDDQIPYRRVGNRRRIRAEDVLAYKRRDDVHRREVLDALSAEGQALGIDY
ncbi:MAG: hypothetical protein BMS9Abin17_0859 [Acidimicrobiia bacterium]|nr:MAG: hypothetical protein BMS9Abin17_0859 [Acidimicrobiia bacterium]